MNDWLEKLHSLNEQHTECVLVTVAKTQGSSPRETGAKLIVMENSIFGTIGGGNLEFKTTELARQALAKRTLKNNARQQLHRFPLGPSLGQCCGGMVILHLEYLTSPMPNWINNIKSPCLMVSQLREEEGANNNDKLIINEGEIIGTLFDDILHQTAVKEAKKLFQDYKYKNSAWLTSVGETADASTKNGSLFFYQSFAKNDFHIVLFGAGHVGKAIVSMLSKLPCQVSWIDSREEEFPEMIPGNVKKLVTQSPVDQVESLTTNSYLLVMTHSHKLDLDLSEQILFRNDFRYFGLIGSKSKRNRFEKRLQQRGIAKNLLQNLTCPIGTSGITDKHPAAIAIAVIAELLQRKEEINQVTENCFMKNNKQQA